MKGMRRPKVTVLSDAALVPSHDLIQPAPNQFTHRLKHDQPFHYVGRGNSGKPDGILIAGTLVVLLFHDGGPQCHIVDGRGLHLSIPFAGLVRLKS